MRLPLPSAQLLLAVLAFTLPLPPAFALLAPEVVEKIQATVVHLETDTAEGSGFLVRADGLILTAGHLLEDTSDLKVTFAHGLTTDATFVGFCPRGHDLAAFRLKSPPPNLPFLSLAPSGSFRIGQAAYSAGFPFPLYSVLLAGGMVSQHRPSHHVLVIDATVSSGNSGGPVFDASGLVLGLATNELINSYDDPSSTTHNYGAGFNLALDAPALARFLQDIDRGHVSQQRTAYFDFLTLPLEHLSAPAVVFNKLTPESDRMYSDRTFVRGYTIDLAAGENISVELSSTDFDSYLFLYDHLGQEVASNDDAHDDTLDSALEHTAENTGRFTILANTVSRDETGDYTLTVKRRIFTEFSRTDHLFTNDTPKTPGDNKHYLDFPLAGKIGQTVALTMTSSDLDAYLILLDASGQVIAENDDMNDNTTDARITHTFTANAPHTLRATTFGSDETGSFTLVQTRAAP